MLMDDLHNQEHKNPSDSQKEGLIDKNKLVAETVQLVDRFLSNETENNTAFYVAVRSDTFKDTLVENATTNPETILQLKTKLGTFLRQRDNIDKLEGMLSQTPPEKRIEPENFDFKEYRQKLSANEGVLKSAEEIASFFKHPVVSYFTNLLVPPEVRKEVTELYNKTVQHVQERMRKNSEEANYPMAIAILPLFKEINEGKRAEIKKEFFGAKWMRDALINGADEMIEKHVEELGEEDARAVFGNDAFRDDGLDNSKESVKTDEQPSFPEVSARIKEQADNWLKTNLRITIKDRDTLDGNKTDEGILYEIRRVLGVATSEGFNDIDTAKSSALKYLAELAEDSTLSKPTKQLISKATYRIKNDKNYFIWT